MRRALDADTGPAVVSECRRFDGGLTSDRSLHPPRVRPAPAALAARAARRPKKGRQQGARRFVQAKDGSLVENGESEGRGKAAASQFTGGNLDPEAVSRHHKSLRRMGFASNAHAKGAYGIF